MNRFLNRACTWLIGCVLCCGTAWAAPTNLVIIDPGNRSVEDLIREGHDVVAEIGTTMMLLRAPGDVRPDELLRIVPDGSDYFLAAMNDPSAELIEDGFRILFEDSGVYLIALSEKIDMTRITMQRVELKHLTLRPMKHPREIRKPVVSRDVIPEIQTMVSEVSLTNFQAIMYQLVSYPNRYSCGSGQGPQAAAWIRQEFLDMGYTDVRYQDFDNCSDNVIARKPGLINPERVWVIGAHYDSYATGTAPGADDNGSGTAAILEIARVMQTRDFEDTIEFVLYASEELGLYGSDAYAAEAESAGVDIIGSIAIDMIGYLESGDTADIDIIDNTSSNWLELQTFQAIQDYVTGTPYKDSQLPGGASSDHASFWDHGYSAILLFEDYPDYSPYIHTANDTIDTSLNNWPLAMAFTKTALATLAVGAVPVPSGIYMMNHVFDDSTGDNDATIDPGETIEFVVTVKNNLGQTAENVSLQLQCSGNCSGVTVTQPTANLGTLAEGETRSNDAQPFIVVFSSMIPNWTDVTFTVNISASGPYINAVSFTETVTSAVFSREYFWNMDTNPNWTVVGGSGNYRFQWGVPTGQGGEYGEPDPTAGYTGSNVYGYNLSGDYPDSMSEQTLTTGAINCSHMNGTTLNFQAWLGVEQPSYDHARVQISTNGTTFSTVWENGSTLNGGAWSPMNIDISAQADGQSSVYIRWTMGPTDSGWTYCGWNIDDVSVWGWTIPGAGTPSPTPPPTATPAPGTPTPTRTPTQTLPTHTPIPSNTPSSTPTTPGVPTNTPAPYTPTATPTGDFTPPPTSTVTPAMPTGTPAPGLTIDIVLNASDYSGGDPMTVDVDFAYSGDDRTADFYLLLEVYGSYYFYPSWGLEMDHQTMQFDGMQSFRVPILNFVLPTPLGEAGPFAFYGAVFDAGSFDLVSNVSSESFSFI